MDKISSVLLVGGPDAGKTNFLIRLWIAIHTSKSYVHMNGLPDNLDYLQAGAEKLLAGEFVPRSSQEIYDRSIIPIQCTSGTDTFRGTLILPDCSGEEWLKIYRKREWSDIWENSVSDSCGLLLFIRIDSDQVVPALDWTTWGGIIHSSSPLSSSKRIEPELPTQMILVDWLQFFRCVFTDRVNGSFRPRVGIVLSAWDRVPTEQRNSSPEAYLDANFHMLMQFVQSNVDDFDFAVFGLSIVGGDLINEPGFKAKYLRENPDESGYVVHSLNGKTEISNDLTLPVGWAMGLKFSPNARGAI